MSQLQEFAPGLLIKNITPPLSWQNYKVIAFDMDSTLIDMETIDEIAAMVGKKAEVAAITEAAMRGEIKDYKESLMRRLALLKGTSVEALEQVRSQRLRFNPGAEALIKKMQKRGIKTMLLSGGFTFYTDTLKEQLGFDFTRSNQLEIIDGKLTGNLLPQEWGLVCDGEAKKQALIEFCTANHIALHEAIAMGDGANDLPMMSVAGLSVAYHAKPAVQEETNIVINQGGLDRLLELFEP